MISRLDLVPPGAPLVCECGVELCVGELVALQAVPEQLPILTSRCLECARLELHAFRALGTRDTDRPIAADLDELEREP